MLCEYDFYRGVYLGEMNERDFLRYGQMAGRFLRYATRGKIEKASAWEEEIKYCFCALADLMQKDAERDGIAKEATGDYAVNYETGAVSEGWYRLAGIYLGESGLMYRGCAR